MIPKNITRENIIKAFHDIDIGGIPKHRESTGFDLLYEGRHYPPKVVISFANIYANGIELNNNFSGGQESNNFLKKRGFTIVDKNFNNIENNTWIFQANPRYFDIDKYLIENRQIFWSIRQKHYVDEVHIGDEVFLWRSDGVVKSSGGIIARCIVTGLPEWTSKKDIIGDGRYWKDSAQVTDCETVSLDVKEYRLDDKMIKRIDLIEDEILKKLKIIRRTNYKLSAQEAILIKQLWTLEINNFEIQDEEGSLYPEGKISYAIHKKIERNAQLIKDVKARYLKIKGELRCEACTFSFYEKYGDIGKNFIELHHTKPVSEVGERETYIKDCVIVCSNCHSMLHIKRPCLRVDELKALLK